MVDSLQHVQSADDVGIDIEVRVLQLLADPGLGAEMNVPLRPSFGEDLLHSGAVGEVPLVERRTLAPLKLGKPGLLQLYVIVGIEITEADDLIGQSAK